MLGSWLQTLSSMGHLSKAVVFSGDPAFIRSLHEVVAVPDVLPATWLDYMRGRLGRNRANFRKVLQEYERCGIIVVGGGNLFFDLPDSNVHLVQLLRRIERACDAQKYVLVLGVGMGPMHLPESRKRVTSVLSRVHAITTRESDSYDCVRELGITGPEVHLSADPSFLLPVPDTESMRRRFPDVKKASEGVLNIALCVKNSSMARPNYRQGIEELMKFFQTLDGVRLFILPFQVAPPASDDTPTAKRLLSLCRPGFDAQIVSEEPTPLEYLGLISNMDLIVGEKLHATVFAIQAGTPFVALSYAPKIRSLLKDLDLESQCLDVQAVSGSEIADKVKQTLSRRAELKAQLVRLLPDLKIRASLSIDVLREYVSRVFPSR